MASTPCSKWNMRFHWLTFLAICCWSGHCSADCNEIRDNTVFEFSEAETAGYELFNVSANFLSIVTVGQNNEFKDWLNVNDTSADFWEVTLRKPFDADISDSGTVSFNCDKIPNAADFIPVKIKCRSTLTSNEVEKQAYLQILDIDEYEPHFEPPDPTVSISESQQSGTTVYTVRACDLDRENTEIVFSIIEGADGYFDIPNTYKGDVVLLKDLDYDSGTRLFDLNISATEFTSDGFGLVNYTILTISVEDVDDIMPEFINPPYTLPIPEGHYTGQEWFDTIPVLSARDGDHDINTTIHFKIGKGSQYCDLFTVAENGSIAVNGSLKFGTYSILVEAYQTDKPSLRYVTTLVTITVTDVNDHAPEIIQSVYSANVSEYATPGTVVLTVKAVDEDVGNNSVIEFHLDKTGESMFTVDTEGFIGVIRLRLPLNREVQANYTFQLWAEETLTKEHRNSSESQVLITVLDENDSPPQFEAANYTFPLTTAHQKGYIIGQVSATDPDEGVNGQITYAIRFSPLVPSAFSINNITGNISLSRNLQYTDVGVYELTVSATDNAAETTNRRSSFVQATVNILPVNINTPVFANITYTFNVPETTTPGYLVGTVTAVDGDGDVVQYSPSGVLHGYFQLNTTNGEITVIKEPNLEDPHSPAPDVVNFTINATDGQYVTSKNVTVYINSVNEYPPIFVTQRPVTVFENETQGTFVVQVNATDEDAGADGRIIYSLLPTVGSDLFRVDPRSGEIILNCSSCLDPTRGTYDLIIKATDGGSPSLSDTVVVLVKINKTIFAPPKFTQKEYYVSVKENEADQFVLQLSATDGDTPLSELTFSADQVNPKTADHLLMVFSNGSVYINGSADAEECNYFVRDVSVSDGQASDNAHVMINVTDVNEYPPLLNITMGLGPIQIPENISITAFVAAVGAKDEDVSNDDFSYFLSTGADGKFVIDMKTGILTVSGPLDRKLKSEYNITVNVFEHGQPPQLGSGNLIVQVTDSNSAPYFTNGRATVADYDFHVLKNLTVGDLIGSLYATDPDNGSSGQFSFRLQPNVQSSYFSLDKDSGNLTLAKLFNNNNKTEYSLIVMVIDNSDIPKNTTAKVTVHVENIEEPPQWPLPLSTVYVTQSSICKNQQQQLQVFSQEVTTVSTNGDNPVEYSLVNMTTEFSINNISGLLTIKNAPNEGDHAVWLRACNRNSNICSDAVLIVVVQTKKILAFCPTFYTVDVNETAFVNFSFLDLNTTIPGFAVSYNISAGNAEGKFGIGGHDGKLYLAEELNREKTSSYILFISAEDVNSHELAEAQVIVRVLDVTNEAPQFSATIYHGEVSESQVIGTPVFLPLTDIPLVVVATDKDENSHLTYSLDPARDTSNGSFNITVNGTIILAKVINYETIPANFNKTYTFTVEATDGVNSSTATVVVHVQDVNDNSPIFVDPADVVQNVTEGQTSGEDLVLVNATDPDTHTTLVYSIDVIYPTAGAPGVFYIDPLSGMIKILRNLDREEQNEYILNVTVSDGTFKNFKTVTVNVLDANDNSPIFNQTFSMTVIEGDSGIGTNISVTAFDADSGPNANLSYTVISGNVNGSFAFDANVLKTVKALDKESIFHSHGADIILTILAVDSGNTSLSGTGTVFVTITDIDDNPPQFSEERYTAEVSEDAINVTVSLTPPLDLTDADISDCPTYLFILSDTSTPFVVNETTGDLYVIGKLDRETQENYTLQVIAIDNCGRGLNSSAEIFIKILDVDDEPPRFQESVYNFNISKNSQLRQSVGIVEAVDVDTSGDVILYELSGSNMFYVDPLHGEIFLIGDLSSDSVPIFHMTVSACDTGILQQCGNATVHISVTGICPVWNTTSLNLTVKEGEAGSLGYISTLHDDLSNVSYFLNDADGAQGLEISRSGEVTLLNQLNANTADRTRYLISVYAEDYSQPNCSQPGILAITVSGTNDHDPEICYEGHCGDQDIEITIYDGSPENSLIALISARDNDTGPDGDVNLTLTTITSGLENLFSLKATEIILQKEINLTDITANSSIHNDTIDLILTAQDSGQPPRSTNRSIRVKVFVALGDALSFTKQIYFLDVPENAKLNTVIGTVTAKSSSSSTNLQYSIYVPVGNVPFDIDPKSGSITTNAALDRETEGHYLFTVAAHPSQPQVSVLALVVVNITDVNESPKFDNRSIKLTAPENVAPLDLFTFTAHDDDEGSNGSVTYVLASGSSNFDINQTTGVLSVIQALDRENTSSYDLVIKAIDGGPLPLSETVAVHIIVMDRNDHSPNFTQSIYEYNITSSVPPVKVATITATDEDEGPNKDIIYSLQSDRNTFKIDPLTGEIESIAILRRNIYTLVVMAKDQGNPSLNSTVDVIIRLIDNRTNIVPYLSFSTNLLSVIAGMKAGTPINVKITTQDADSLRISGGNGTTFFGIQKDQIVLSQDLSQETVYVLIITATSSTGQNVSQELEIHVDKLEFSQQSYTAAVVENSNVTQTILHIHSNAEKLRIPVIYSLYASSSAFYIDRATGILSVQQPLDRELFSVYVLNVNLSLDHWMTSMTGRRKRAAFSSQAFVTVLVQVEDENDNIPSFVNLGPELHLSVPASVNASYLITTLKAYDPDEGINGLIRYNIISGDIDVFNLNPVSGELRVVSPEKLGNYSTFMLTVVATDRNGTGSNVSLDVWITIEQDDHQFRLSTPLSVSVLNTNKEDILQSLSRILGLTLSNVRVTVHEESGNVDPSRSDILFQAYQHNTNTTTVMSVVQIQTQVSNHQAEIQKLFKSFETQPQTNKNGDDDDMNATSISLIVVACVMFVATLVAIFVTCRMWKKQKKYEKKAAQVRSTPDVKPNEDDGKEKDTSVDSDDVEVTIVSEEPPPTSAVTPDATNLPGNQYLQQVQQSLQALATESADSGIASPVNSDSETSEQDSPVVAQINAVDEDENDASSSAAHRQETDYGTSEVQNEGSSNPLVQKHTYVDVAVENGKDENSTEQNDLEADPAANNSSDLEDASILTLLSQDSLYAVSSSVPPVSFSHDALSQNSIPNDLNDEPQTTDNNIAYHSTAPPVVSSSSPDQSLLNKAFDNSDQADEDSDMEEAITYF